MIHHEMGDQYRSAVILEEYEDVYSIVAGQVGKNDDKVYKSWGKKNTGTAKDPKYTSRDLPWKVSLGDLETAKMILKKFLDRLEAVGQEPADDDIPF